MNVVEWIASPWVIDLGLLNECTLSGLHLLLQLVGLCTCIQIPLRDLVDHVLLVGLQSVQSGEIGRTNPGRGGSLSKQTWIEWRVRL